MWPHNRMDITCMKFPKINQIRRWFIANCGKDKKVIEQYNSVAQIIKELEKLS